MEEFKRMIIKVSDVEGASATVPSTSDHTDGSWLTTDIYEGELFLNLVDNILQTRTDAGIINLNASSSSDADRVVQDVRYDEGVEKGEPLRITGYNVGSGIITVEKADASASADMPSYGLAMANYSSGATGQMIAVGTLTDVDTSAFSEGDTVYVAVGGGLTNVKPIEPNLVQNVGFVARSNANNGSIEVVAIGRANDVPNLPVGHTFIGTETNPTTIDLQSALDSKVDGTGTTNYVSKWTGANTQGNSQIFDNGTSVGIGTTSPNSAFKVDIIGNSIVRGAQYVDGALTYFGSSDFNINSSNSIILKPTNIEAMRITSGGNVGIGTTAPTEALDVVGKIALNDGGNSVFVGTNAGLNDDGSDNQNVGIGAEALRSNTTGSVNTAIGIDALANNTTANSNTAIGRQSLFSNTTGGSNVAVGRASLFSNTTGVSNTAIGLNSLYNNTTSFSNTAIGLNSLYSNTTGNTNTAIGVFSLKSNTTGGNNTANGFQSGNFISDGTTANTITNNSVYIGKDTKALANNQTNQIVIGYDATGIGSNSVVLGNDSITKTALKGNIGIGTTNPDAKLHIVNSNTNDGLILEHISQPDGFQILQNIRQNEGLIWQKFTNGSFTSNLMVVEYSGNVGIGTTAPTEKLEVSGNIKAEGSVQVGDNTDSATASNVGAMRYTTDGTASFADMCMEVSPNTFEWVNIVTNTFD